MSGSRTAMLAALISVLLWLTPAQAQTLIVGIDADQGPPLVIREQGQASGGIVIELMNEFARRQGMAVSYLSLPKKRQEPALLSGQIHVFALTNPLWFRYTDQYRWSEPLFLDQDIFVQHRANRFPLKRFADLRGKRLGTIRGFHYEGLMDYFESGEVIRDDGTNLSQNIDKLLAGRVDALIGSEILTGYLLSQHPDAEQLLITGMIASSHGRHAAFSPYGPVSFSDAYFQLQQMQREGVIEDILSRYR